MALLPISVCMISGAEAHRIGRALESVFGQSYDGDVEVLVVDDGSTDETPELLAGYGDRVHYVRQENGGRSAARNTAVREAGGPYISFLDSDDRWLPDKLARQVPALEADERLGMVHGHVDLIDERDRPLPDETARHHEMFSAAHRNGVTYAGYAFDCRCFSSALTVSPKCLAVSTRKPSIWNWVIMFLWISISPFTTSGCSVKRSSRPKKSP